MSDLPRRPEMGLSRALLFPGPAPPLSHFGVTLLRHVVVTGLRFGLYQLGLRPPEKPPIRIHRLRLYLDGAALAAALADQPGAEEVVAALVVPGGVAAAPRLSRRLAGAATFHRLRLCLPRLAARPRLSRDSGPSQAFHAALSRLLPRLRDAFLAELLAALERRGRRRRGEVAPPCLGEHAWRLLSGRRPRLEFLGEPDPYAESWSCLPDAARAAADAMAQQPVPPRHRMRGSFREHYRAALDRLRPLFLKLAREAARRGLLRRPEEAFYLPFDLAADLERSDRPTWLEPALAANRREHESLLQRPSPAEILAADVEPTELHDGPERWILQPLVPLP
jgi:hypothetical protein